MSLTRSPVLNLGILCISDDGQSDIDYHAKELARRILGAGHRVASVQTVRNDTAAIRAQLEAWIDDGNLDALLVLDRSIFSDGDIFSNGFGDGNLGPNFGLSDRLATQQTYGLVLNDPDFGLVGVIDIRSSHRYAA